ncbi:MAG: hypothetical protein OEZ37_11935, partial [Gemmatimonadota bacterium]|nr:hypothetical protein [Gemmatimonadota bacterium]
LLKTLDRTPDDPMAVSMLRTTYHLMGREDEALEMWRTRYRVLGDEELLEALDRGARQGGYASGLRWVAEAMVKRSDTQHVTPWQIATAYTRAGMEEQALDYLELAYEARDPNVPYISIDPIFDPFRNRPRFQALLHNLGLPD